MIVLIVRVNQRYKLIFTFFAEISTHSSITIFCRVDSNRKHDVSVVRIEFSFRRRTAATTLTMVETSFVGIERRGKRGEQIDEHIHTQRIRTRKRTRTRTRTKDREKKRGQQGTRYGILRASRVLFYVYLCLNIHDTRKFVRAFVRSSLIYAINYT